MLDGHLSGFAAIILAGGRASRLDGRDKPMVVVEGLPMLARVVGAVREAGAETVVVVGPEREGLAGGVKVVREEPAGGGPVAATAAGVAAVDEAEVVGLFAADLPYLAAGAVRGLVEGLGEYDGALFVDGEGRRQLLCGVWKSHALREAIERFGDAGGGSLRRLVEGLRIREMRWDGERAPYFDCDTEEDLRRVGL